MGKKKVGILGGTFNPIHCGHIKLAENALYNADLDEVWFIPSGISYMKNQKEIVSAFHRMEMVKLAIKGNDCFKASDIEIVKKGNSYSYETMETLAKMYPDIQFYFIIGADTVFTIETWKYPERIFRVSELLVMYRLGEPLEAVREQISALKQKFGARIILLACEPIPISSSDIRKKIKDKHSIHHMVPATVEAYMKENGLYEMTGDNK